ncbi:restriction endonuclease subunit S [Clostridium beijerinckii]|nr:restriction endonuclease subunit S [Clostridium beijerinckii]
MNEVKFKEFIKLNRGFDLPNDKMVFGEYPVVASTNIKGFHNNFKVKGPCVVTGRSGSLGAVQYIISDCIPLNTTLYVKDFKDNYPKYVYYYLKTMHLEAYNSGAGVPTLNQNHLHNIKLKIHDYNTQQKIADTLSAYDELIENNNRRIELLEKTAENLYKEWFVRFRFPNYKETKFEKGLPQKWEVRRLSEFIYVTDGTHDTPKQTESGNYLITGKCITNDFIDFSKAYFISEYDHEKIKKRSGLDKGDILFSNIGTVGSVSIIDYGIDFSVKNVIILKPQSDIEKCYLYCLLKNSTIQELFKQQTNGSSQQFISLGFMRGFKVLIPSMVILERFKGIVEPIIAEKYNLYKKNQNLIKQRDLLLPRLMSGKLEV